MPDPGIWKDCQGRDLLHFLVMWHSRAFIQQRLNIPQPKIDVLRFTTLLYSEIVVLSRFYWTRVLIQTALTVRVQHQFTTLNTLDVLKALSSYSEPVPILNAWTGSVAVPFI
jgi:hypothetical protein